MESLRSIDLSLIERLQDPEFRRHWFRAELETSVPRQFREMRERRKMTQSDLAKIADMKQSAISRFESSTDAKWKLDTLLRLADALKARLSIYLDPEEDVVAETQAHEEAERLTHYAPTQYVWYSAAYPSKAVAAFCQNAPADNIIGQYARQQRVAFPNCTRLLGCREQSKPHVEGPKPLASVRSALGRPHQGVGGQAGSTTLLGNQAQ